MQDPAMMDKDKKNSRNSVKSDVVFQYILVDWESLTHDNINYCEHTHH